MAIGKITAIPFSPNSAVKAMASSLAAVGKTRYPGTGVYHFPKKNLSGEYLTGLNENTLEIEDIPDEKERKETKKRIKEKRERLERLTGFDLSPKSSFWNYALYTDKDQAHVQGIKLMDGDNLFDFSSPINEISFNWIKQCDDVAPSYESYVRGDKGPDVRFYVHDDNIENKRKFDRKKEINEAVIASDSLSPEKRKKVAILMGLNISADAPESTVYNILDDKLKETEFTSGKFKGLSPVKMFTSLLKIDDIIFNAKYLVEEAIKFNIYRVRAGGALFEGEFKVADNQESMVTFLCNEDNQKELIVLEKKIKGKKLMV